MTHTGETDVPNPAPDVAAERPIAYLDDVAALWLPFFARARDRLLKLPAAVAAHVPERHRTAVRREAERIVLEALDDLASCGEMLEGPGVSDDTR